MNEETEESETLRGDLQKAEGSETLQADLQRTEVSEKEAAKEGESKRSIAEYIKRYLFLIVGLTIMSFGVAFSINAALGTSPVSSIPYVTSVISGLSVGVTTMIVNSLIVLLQVLILRRKFQPIRLLQIPVCIVFGLLIDLASFCIADCIPSNYVIQWIMCISGIVLVAVGVSFEMSADVLTLAGEGLVQALCKVLPIKFGYMKVIVDVSFVVIALACSFLFLHGLHGVREGTVAAAIFVGLIAKQLHKVVAPLSRKLFETHTSSKNMHAHG